MKYILPKALTYNLISPDYPASALDNLNAALLAGMNAEQDWGVGQAAGPLIRWFEYSHGNVGGGKAWALSQLPLVPGRPSPFFEALDNSTQDGAVLVRGSGVSGSMAYAEGQVDAEWREPSRMILVVLAGGDVEDVCVYFQIDDPNADVPVTLPNRTYQDANNQTIAYKWNEWGVVGESHKPKQVGEHWYKPSTMYQSGVPLKATDWIAYAMAGGVVISEKAYNKVVADNAPSLP